MDAGDEGLTLEEIHALSGEVVVERVDEVAERERGVRDCGKGTFEEKPQVTLHEDDAAGC